jgi:hypothetical protein
VDRVCLSGGTRRSCPSTPQLSIQLWFSFECLPVSVCLGF